MRCVMIVALLAAPLHAAAPPVRPKKLVLIAGPKSHGPVGNGVHDYGWSVRLIRAALGRSNVAQDVRVEAHLGGWPKDPATLTDADAVLIVSDGRDGALYEEAPHLATAERVRAFDALMRRGCGLMTFHFSTFAPERYRDEVLRWNGGYFQWEQGGKRAWYSAIRTLEADVAVAAHPVTRGVKPFRLREEFYYNLRLAPDAVPLASVAELKGRAPDGNVVAWALQRGRGRGFGTTCGHFYDNWASPMFRRLMLNGLVWSAGAVVPRGGVDAPFLSHEEIERAERPVRALLIAGNDAHRWHNWEKTTPRIREALERDPRVGVEVTTDAEDLSRRRLSDYRLIVLNYCNWHDGRPLGEASRRALTAFVGGGGGLISVHFANGAFHRSLPLAGASDWPEYRRLVRRAWDHAATPPSGHDAFGRFTVRPAGRHPIVDGLRPFEVTDELYFRQAGDEPVGEPLIVAESRVTKKLEPLAWAYRYGEGRVFQTLLGHSEKTYDAAEACEMLRRAAAWAAAVTVGESRGR